MTNIKYRIRYFRRQKYMAISINRPYCMLRISDPGWRHHHRITPSTHHRRLYIYMLVLHLLPVAPASSSFFILVSFVIGFTLKTTTIDNRTVAVSIPILSVYEIHIDPITNQSGPTEPTKTERNKEKKGREKIK